MARILADGRQSISPQVAHSRDYKNFGERHRQSEVGRVNIGGWIGLMALTSPDLQWLSGVGCDRFLTPIEISDACEDIFDILGFSETEPKLI